MNLDSKIPEGHYPKNWDNHRFSSVVNPANNENTDHRGGSGLAGGSAAATLGELG